MSDGKQPTTDDESTADQSKSVSFGDTLYSSDGTPLGDVRGLTEGGVVVTMRDGIEALAIEHTRSGHDFGEAELMWRCLECGEMGQLNQQLPDSCPNCGVSREHLTYWTED